MTTTVHKFELAGLGKAPFRLVGFTEKRCSGQPSSNGVTVGTAGQPAGTCDFCATGIANCYVIASADGKEFIVGEDCVRKTGDAGLVDFVARAANKMKRDKQLDRDKQLVTLYDERIQALLQQTPGAHPNAYFAKQGKTMGDYLLFAYLASGTTGKAKIIRKHIKD